MLHRNLGRERLWSRSWNRGRLLHRFRPRIRTDSDEVESFPGADVGLGIHNRSSSSRVSSQVGTVDAFEAYSSVCVSDQVVGFPRTDGGLDVDSCRMASRVSSDVGVVEGPESHLSIAKVEQSELLPGSDEGLDIHSCALSSRVSSDKSSVVGLESELLFFDDGVRICRRWLISHDMFRACWVWPW